MQIESIIIPPLEAYIFGPFRLTPSQRLLERSGHKVPLGERALDLLIGLVEGAGIVISKQDLIAKVWPNVMVDEGSLRVRLTELRKALGDGKGGARYTANIRNQGYCFVAPVTQDSSPRSNRQSKSLEAFPAAKTRQRALPVLSTKLLGRDETVMKLTTQLTTRRFVTIVGAGGVGKSTAAIAVAHELVPAFPDGVYFIDLGQLNESGLVMGLLASTLGLSVQSENPLASILNFLREKTSLLILDSCEHVINAVAGIVHDILAKTAHVHILATSREPIRLGGEQLHRLSGLEVPPENSLITAEQVLTYPAAQLLLERIQANHHDFVLRNVDAPVVSAICRSLDGVAGAIELTAGHVDAFGLRGTRALLIKQFGLMIKARRFAHPRHQTLVATLDWSYNLLTEFEKAVARNLSKFVGPFTLEAAQAVIEVVAGANHRILQTIADLASKSLIVVDISGPVSYYRLLETTRSYLSIKADELSEAKEIGRRHSLYYRHALEDADARTSTFYDSAVLHVFVAQLPNIQRALEWAFSADGEAETAISLAIVSAPIFLETSRLTECLSWTTKALTMLDASSRGSVREMELQAAFGLSMMFTTGGSWQANAALKRGLELARDVGNPYYQLRLLGAMFKFHNSRADLNAARAIAEQSAKLAQQIDEPISRAMANSMLGLSLHLAGDQQGAQEHCEHALTPIAHDPRKAVRTIRFDFVYRDVALYALMRTTWLRGYPEKALQLAEQALRRPEALNAPVLHCITLIWVTSLYLLMGKLEIAEPLIEQLTHLSHEFSLGPYQALSQGLRGSWLIRQGQIATGVVQLRASLRQLNQGDYKLFYSDLSRDLAEALAVLGDFDQAMAVIDDALTKVLAKGEGHILADLYRVKGAIFMSSPGDHVRDAEGVFLQSLAISQAQNTPAWALRTAGQIARLRHAQGRTLEARSVLLNIFDGFSEGFDTRDLIEAKAILDEISVNAV